MVRLSMNLHVVSTFLCSISILFNGVLFLLRQGSLCCPGCLELAYTVQTILVEIPLPQIP